MIFCLRCRRIVPKGDYCPWCRGAWGASICQDCDHRNSPGVPSCVMCPGINLSEAVMGIPLGWCATMLSGLVLIGLIRLSASHAGTLLSGAGKGGVWFLCLVTGSTATQLHRMLVWLLTAVFVIAPIAGELMRRLPGQGGYLGYRLRALPMTALDYLWSLLVRVLLGGGHLVLQLFFGKGKSAVKGTP
jgi:hypothetical protein